MPMPIDDYQNHDVHEAITELKQVLTAVRRSDTVKQDQSIKERVDSLKAVVPFVESRIRSIDPSLCPATTLSNLQSQAARAATALNNYSSSSNDAQIQNAEKSIDQMLVLSSQLPVPESFEDLEALGASIQESRRSIAGYLGSLKRQVNREKESLSTLQAQLGEVKAEIDGQKGSCRSNNHRSSNAILGGPRQALDAIPRADR